MKKIFLFWFGFSTAFLGLVVAGYQLWWNESLLIGALFALYFLFQAISLWMGLTSDQNWLFSSLIVQVLFAILGPLYYSNFWDPVYEFVTGEWFRSDNAFDPCQLCWWARILMFPLLPLSIMAFVTRQRLLLWYIYGASWAGICLEIFHYTLQKFSIPNPFGCTDANPCSALWVEYFGFITIPFLCLIAFLVIHIFVSVLLFTKKFEKNRK